MHGLLSHYRFALKCLPSQLFEAVYVQGNAPLGTLTMKDGSLLTLCLRPPIDKGCEGELCIQLNDADDQPLYRIVFTVIDGGQALVIGCLQGPGGEQSKERVRALTRHMHGMRPKQLMLSLVYAFAGQFRIRRILAVSNAVHPLRHRRRRFDADYDSFWLEQKGHVRKDGLFALPVAPARKTEADVPSHHRSAFRKREALRVESERLLTDALGTMPPRSFIAPVEERALRRSFYNVHPEASWTS
ncbi:hypothetical protein GCM10009105_32290 [Dokdonella soli]|uniref:DUF535 domain-containing protein n=1 Tax=Dokdonella soli TaxID=529810 RepID=A0ABN1IV84_9GAMM